MRAPLGIFVMQVEFYFQWGKFVNFGALFPANLDNVTIRLKLKF
jgi:hypothetical protein